jgi:hypothetical protein
MAEDNDTPMEEEPTSTAAEAEAPTTPVDKDTMDDATTTDTEELPPPRLIITSMVCTKHKKKNECFQVYLYAMVLYCILSRVATRLLTLVLYVTLSIHYPLSIS